MFRFYIIPRKKKKKKSFHPKKKKRERERERMLSRRILCSIAQSPCRKKMEERERKSVRLIKTLSAIPRDMNTRKNTHTTDTCDEEKKIILVSFLPNSYSYFTMNPHTCKSRAYKTLGRPASFAQKTASMYRFIRYCSALS
jgi:hypothetical protein